MQSRRGSRRARSHLVRVELDPRHVECRMKARRAGQEPVLGVAVVLLARLGRVGRQFRPELIQDGGQ